MPPAGDDQHTSLANCHGRNNRYRETTRRGGVRPTSADRTPATRLHKASLLIGCKISVYLTLVLSENFFDELQVFQARRAERDCPRQVTSRRIHRQGDPLIGSCVPAPPHTYKMGIKMTGGASSERYSSIQKQKKGRISRKAHLVHESS